MENSDDIKIEKLDKIITIRITDEDYHALLCISENRKSNVSKIIRTIITPLVDLIKENNNINN